MIVGATFVLISETNAAATLRSEQGAKGLKNSLAQKSSKRDKKDDGDDVKGISISKTFEYSGCGNVDLGDIMQQALAGAELEKKPKKKRDKKRSGKRRG